MKYQKESITKINKFITNYIFIINYKYIYIYLIGIFIIHSCQGNYQNFYFDLFYSIGLNVDMNLFNKKVQKYGNVYTLS